MPDIKLHPCLISMVLLRQRLVAATAVLLVLVVSSSSFCTAAKATRSAQRRDIFKRNKRTRTSTSALSFLQQDVLSLAMDGLYRSAAGTSYCSCECCESHESVSCQAPSASSLTTGYQCGYSKPFDDQSGSCSERCYPPDANGVNVPSEENQARFCELNCRVTKAESGATCEMAAPEMIQKTQPTEAREGGNPCALAVWSNHGTGLDAYIGAVPPLPLVDSNASDSSGEETGAAREANAEENEDENAKKKEKYEIDLRGLFGRTKMAEAAGAIASAKSASARATYARARAKAASAKVAQVQEAVLQTANEGVESAAEATQMLTAAKEDFENAVKDLQKARVLSEQVAGMAVAEAVKLIKKEVAPIAKKTAELKAEAYGWDKPDFWPRVVAARAAEPYQQQMVTATQRVSEYDGQARQLIAKAIGKQHEAQSEAAKVTSLKDEIERAEADHRVRQLVRESKALEAAAQAAYATAQQARTQVTEYQQAAFAAADAVSGNYTATFNSANAVVA